MDASSNWKIPASMVNVCKSLMKYEKNKDLMLIFNLSKVTFPHPVVLLVFNPHPLLPRAKKMRAAGDIRAAMHQKSIVTTIETREPRSNYCWIWMRKKGIPSGEDQVALLAQMSLNQVSQMGFRPGLGLDLGWVWPAFFKRFQA